MASITPQGYIYGEDPKSVHPFWEENGGDDTPTEVVQVSASATVDDTIGTPSVTVTQSGDNNQNITFAFSGIKGEQGEAGAAGATGPQGEKGDPGEAGAQGEQGPAGVSPTVTSTGNTGSGEIAGTVTSGDNVITIYNGARGETGATGATGPQGEKGDPGEAGAQGEQGPAGVSPTVTSTGNTGSGEIAGTVTSGGNIITIYNGAQGEQGPQGETGAAGSDVDVNGTVTNVSMTSENHIYTISQTKKDNTVESGETTTEVGTIEVPEQERGIVEVKDSVVTNSTNGYDFHTFTETEDGGTENEIGKFYIAENQITGITISQASSTASGNTEISITTVDQSGQAQSSVLGIETSAGATGTRWHRSTIISSINSTVIGNTVTGNIRGILANLVIIEPNGGSLRQYFFIPFKYLTNSEDSNRYSRVFASTFNIKVNYNASSVYLACCISAHSSQYEGVPVEITISGEGSDEFYVDSSTSSVSLYLESS